MTVYNMQSIINCRDLGGHRCKSGFTASGRALRCGIPRAPSKSDLEAIERVGIKTVIDLRGAKEAENAPSYFLGDPKFDYYNIPLLEANPALSDSDIPMWKMYALSLTDFADGYARVFRLIGSLKEPFLYHCFLGKDRTGVLTALLLSSAGVGKDEIAEDYAVSFKYLKPFVEKETAAKTGLIWEQDISRLESKKEYILDTLNFVDRKFGGVNAYLLSTGLSQAEIDRAAGRLMC